MCGKILLIKINAKGNYLFKILIIENDEGMISFLSGTLKKEKYKVIIAGNKKSGLLIANREKPNLILCSLKGKDIDGLEILSEIRNNNSLLSTIFFFIAPKTERTLYRQAMEKGADDYLTTPITRKELLNAVSSRLKRQEAIKKYFSSLLKQKESSIQPEEKNLEDGVLEKLDLDDKILVDSDERHKLVKVRTIKMINSVGDYSKIMTFDGNRFFFRKTMKEWEEILPGNNFIRIHRSTIINLDYVDKLIRTSNRAFNVFLKNESKPVNMSRRYSIKFKDRFSK